MKSKVIKNQFEKTIQSKDDLLQQMDKEIIKMAISSAVMEWQGFLMHLDNTVMFNRDGYDIEVAAAACAYVFDNPCRNETEQDIIKAVYSMRDELLAQAKEAGICNSFTPEELIAASKAGKMIELRNKVNNLDCNI